MGAGEMWHHLISPLFFYNEEIIVIFFLNSLLFSEKVFKKSLIESLKFLQSAFECPGWAGTVILGSSGDWRMCLMGNTWAVSNPSPSGGLSRELQCDFWHSFPVVLSNCSCCSSDDAHREPEEWLSGAVLGGSAGFEPLALPTITPFTVLALKCQAGHWRLNGTICASFKMCFF